MKELSGQLDERSADTLRVFISYSRIDRFFASILQPALQTRGFDAFIDTADIVAGEDWKARLAGLIRAADAVLFILSPDWAASDICAWEVERARALEKHVAPIHFRHTPTKDLPPDIARIHFADGLDIGARYSNVAEVALRERYALANREPQATSLAAILESAAISFRGSLSARLLNRVVDAVTASLRAPDVLWLREHTRLVEMADLWDAGGRPEASLLRMETVVAAREWGRLRPRGAPILPRILLDFLDKSENKEAADLERRRRIIQRAFVAPIQLAIAGGAGDKALRMTAVGALLSDDPKFELDARVQGPNRSALLKAGLRSVDHPVRAVIQAHSTQITALDFSPCGHWLLTASRDGTARIWHAATGEAHHSLLRHSGPLTAASFSPDGALIMTTSEDGTAHIWRLEDNVSQPLWEMAHAGAVLRAEFSPNGKYAVTASTDSTAQLWDVENRRKFGKTLRHARTVWSARFSPDATRVITSSRDRTVRVWDAKTGEALDCSIRLAAAFCDARFTPDGKRILSVSSNPGTDFMQRIGGVAQLWDATTFSQIATPMLHGHLITSAEVNTDATCLVTTSLDRTARLWNAVTGEPLSSALPHSDEIYCAAFNPCGPHVATGSRDGKIRFWSAQSGKLVGGPLHHGNSVERVVFSKDGLRMATASADGSVRIWRGSIDSMVGSPLQFDGSVEFEPFRPSCPVSYATFDPDGTRAITVSKHGTVCLAAAATGKVIGEVLSHKHEVHQVAWSSDGRFLLIVFGNNAVVRDSTTGVIVAAAIEHNHTIMSANFNRDGSQIITGSVDQTVRLWRTSYGKAIGNPMRHEEQVFHVSFSPDGSQAVSGSLDRTARIWNLYTQKPVGKAMQHGSAVVSAIFSPDNKTVVTCSGNAATLWDSTSGAILGAPMQHEGTVNSAVFSPDGARIVTGSDDWTAMLWDAKSLSRIGEPMVHDLGVNSAKFSYDGARIVTASKDGSARMWDAFTGYMMAQPLNHGTDVEVCSAEFNRGGTRVITTTWDKTARIWDVSRTCWFTGDPMTYLTVALKYGIGKIGSDDNLDLLLEGLETLQTVNRGDLCRAFEEKLSEQQRPKLGQAVAALDASLK